MVETEVLKKYLLIGLCLVLLFLYVKETRDHDLLKIKYTNQTKQVNLYYDETKSLDKSLAYCNTRVERFEMYYNNTYGKPYNGTYPNGINFGKWFSVWTEGRSYASVIETCNHEWVHSKQGKEHFCGDVNE